MSPTGPEAVCTVSRVRFSNMFTQLFLIFLFLLDGSVTFMWTSLALSSPSWTGHLVGQRLFLHYQPPLRIVLEPWFPVGFQGLESLPRFLLIEEYSLPLLSGLFHVPFLNISHSKTTSFHPQSNGLVEHFHHSLKTSLRAPLAGSDWFDHLPLVMLGLWTTPCDKTQWMLKNFIPFQILAKWGGTWIRQKRRQLHTTVTTEN